MLQFVTGLEDMLQSVTNTFNTNIFITMSTKVVRLDEDAIEICLKYGKTISEGVRNMEKKISLEKNLLDPKSLERMIRSAIQDELEVLQRGY